MDTNLASPSAAPAGAQTAAPVLARVVKVSPGRVGGGKARWGLPTSVASPAAPSTLVPDAAVLCAALQALGNQISHGLMLLGAQAQVLYLNPSARSQLQGNPWLGLVAGRLQARQATDQSELLTLLWAAQCGQRSVLQLGRPAAGKGKGKASVRSSAAFTLAFTPAAGTPEPAGTPADPSQAHVAVLFARPHWCEPVMLHHFATAHQLTGAEQTVLHWFCQDLALPAIAQQMGIALSTVRSHVKSITLKTGCRGMRSLQSRLAQLPPLAAAG